jgi:hypothetical protein
MGKVLTALATSVDGFIAGPDDSLQQPLGTHGSRLFDWFTDGDTPSRFYEQFQQCLRAGLLDEIHIHQIPVLLGSGVRLLDHLGPEPIELECLQVVAARGVTHLSYRVTAR